MSDLARPPDSLFGLRVVVVEDDTPVALYLEDVLEEFGCVIVGVAGTLPEAIDLTSNGAFDIAVVDIDLKGNSSLPVVQVLISRGIPYLVATGYDSLPKEFPTCRVLPKPFIDKQLREALESCALRSVRKMLTNLASVFP